MEKRDLGPYEPLLGREGSQRKEYAITVLCTSCYHYGVCSVEIERVGRGAGVAISTAICWNERLNLFISFETCLSELHRLHRSSIKSPLIERSIDPVVAGARRGGGNGGGRVGSW